jgi:IS30 family transposase
MNTIISPLLKQGQSVHNIITRHKDALMVDESTLYKYIKMGLFDARPSDLLNMVKMRPRRKRPGIKVERDYQKGRSYRDFLIFTQQHPDIPIVQMDSVEGKKGGGESVLLTLHFVQAELMLAFKRSANTARSVQAVIDQLYHLLGKANFKTLFPVILTDLGSEFSHPSALENDARGEKRTRIFYTEPASPYQKGACENNHSLIRRVIKKGLSLNPYDQEDIQLLMNHINSYQRKKLNNKTPIEVFNFLHHPSILETLGVTTIDPDQVTLTSSLLR